MAGLLERLRDIASTYPDRLAHVGSNGEITYLELWQRAAVLASRFEATLASREPVIVRGHKDTGMLVAFLGAVLSGRAYIPLDSSIPEARVENIIASARPSAVVMSEEVTQWTDGWASSSAVPELRQADDEDPFYIIFTSGSTGDPKGVVITHGCLTAFVDWTLAEQGFRPGGEVFLNQAPFSFDLSVMDLYSSLFSGGTLVSLAKDDVADPRRLYAKLRQSGITTWVSTPSFAQMCLVERSFDAAMMPQLRRFWFCGEALAHKTAANLRTRFPESQVWNTYGPTEATVATTSILVDDEVLKQHDPLPIGKARPGTRVGIHTPEGQWAADEERGEIVIAGPNVSPGYLGRPDLTEKAFFTLEGQRAYRTGDRGFAKGDLLFFEGRMDFQVKVRGYRIELGDVESHLRDITGVVEAVVLPAMRRGVCESLAAFIVMREKPADGPEPAQALRDKLAETLPDYMIPKKVTFLEAFPMTANGKADRKALAAMLG